MMDMAVLECKKSSNDIINDDTKSDEEVVASDVPLWYLFFKGLVEIMTYIKLLTIKWRKWVRNSKVSP